MFIVLLRFAENRGAAAQHMAGHQAWIRQGLEDGVFLLTGSIQPGLGGVVPAHGMDRAGAERRVAADPFVAERVVEAEIIEVAPGMADKRLDFLLS
ncbi:uncharacterized protein YciI [Actinoplanes octamycinicus]|uniref:Uncharacterized protein YciI n=1 Tax=Actinoplanes octamycinicus TaxID=135948 RepID=A0A7W7MB84_9ACTN|nr:hypothetical protein [Actinoplanes octamycinicus]MBB4743838.1 uncharacterized protein YciI [Actinoplanes octamycinicus]GIE58467.1 hypothetical protein Aoc01nite_38690 [Actinoplanes octamycinicus]